MREVPKGMRAKVLAAAELIADRGLDGTKMEDIAAKTSVPKATLYYYFSGKEDILAFLFNEVLDEVATAIDVAVRAEGTAAERLGKLVREHLGVFETYPAASRALQFDLGRAARTPTINDRAEGAFRQPVRQLLEEGAVDGSLRSVRHPGIVATAILGTITNVGINAIASHPGRSADDITDDIVTFLLEGIGAG